MLDPKWISNLLQEKPAETATSIKASESDPVTTPAIPGIFCPGDSRTQKTDLTQDSDKLQPELPEVSELDLASYSDECNSDIPTGKPCSGEFWPNTSIESKINPPDISQGLGKRQEKRDIVQLERFLVTQRRLMVYHDALYIYKPPIWRKLSDNQAGAEIRSALEGTLKDDCLTRSDYSKIYRSLLINPDLRKEKELIPPEGMINMLDGTYNIYTGRLLPHRADDYFLSYINVRGMELDIAQGHSFEAFVQNCSDGDPAVREQLLQLVALVILKKPFKHFFVLLGESNTGKTQFGRFLEELVGRANVESIRGVQDF